jgi:D-lactate dehydrogenase (cytochrome)
MSSDLFKEINNYTDFLRDESRLTGFADAIAFPRTEGEVVELLRMTESRREPVTLQGARTGITGGAVPQGGKVINFSRMDRIHGLRYISESNTFSVIVQPGVTLTQLNNTLMNKSFDTSGWRDESLKALAEFRKSKPYFFTPDPTETTASLGGMASCNASGARSYLYGSTRHHIYRARIGLVGGGILELKRGEHRAEGRKFSVQTENQPTLTYSGEVPSYNMPAVKNAAGYFALSDMDILDLFIGSEGTLGCFVELELLLKPFPPVIYGMMIFFADMNEAIDFVKNIRTELQLKPILSAVEFFDSNCLELLRRWSETASRSRPVPAIDTKWKCAVYLELHAFNETDAMNGVELIDAEVNRSVKAGNDTWMADNQSDMEILKTLRHAVPESVNLLIDEIKKREPEITKLGTDLAVPDDKLDEVIDLYCGDLTKYRLRHVIFGHIGNNHLHVNIIPENMRDYQTGKELYLQWARTVVKMGGTVSAEHGIGKLKRAFLLEMYGEAGVQQMRKVKKIFDPYMLLNRGCLFDAG